jgi:threonine dehydrogenase-like Zn-dependent dehydrogenase
VNVVFGHEFCCEVVDHGPGTDKRFKVGTLVCSIPMTTAGNTVHGIGYSNRYRWRLAQYMPLAERLLLEGESFSFTHRDAIGFTTWK